MATQIEPGQVGILQREVLKTRSHQQVDIVKVRDSINGTRDEVENKFPTMEASDLSLVMHSIQNSLPNNWYESWKKGNGKAIWDKSVNAVVNDSTLSQNFRDLDSNKKSKLIFHMSWLLTGNETIKEQIDNNVNNPVLKVNINQLRQEVDQHEKVGSKIVNGTNITNAINETQEVFGLDDDSFNEIVREIVTAFQGDNLEESIHDQKKWKETFTNYEKSDTSYKDITGNNLKDLFYRVSWILTALVNSDIETQNNFF